MQVIQNTRSLRARGQTTLVSGQSDYIPVLRFDETTAANIRISIADSGNDPVMVLQVAASWKTCNITGSLSQVMTGHDGVYAIRVQQNVDGGPMSLWVTFSTPPSGDIFIEVTADYALKDEGGLFVADTMIRSSTAPGNIIADLNFASGSSTNVWGTSATKI